MWLSLNADHVSQLDGEEEEGDDARTGWESACLGKGAASEQGGAPCEGTDASNHHLLVGHGFIRHTHSRDADAACPKPPRREDGAGGKPLRLECQSGYDS